MNSLLASKPRRRISLTPLIDVVFILLMFFMLTSSFVQWREIDLPQASVSQQSQIANDSEPVFLRLYSNGAISVWPSNQRWPDATAINPSDLPETELSQQYLLIPENDTQLQTMIVAMEHLQGLGLKVQLTDPVEQHDGSGGSAQ